MPIRLPIAAFYDIRHWRQPGHNVHPSICNAPVSELCLEKLAVIDLGIFFQTIHSVPILKRNFDQFCLDCIFAFRLKSRVAIAGIIERTGYGTRDNADSVPTKMVVAFARHKSSIYDEFDGVHFMVFLFLVHALCASMVKNIPATLNTIPIAYVNNGIAPHGHSLLPM